MIKAFYLFRLWICKNTLCIWSSAKIISKNTTLGYSVSILNLRLLGLKAGAPALRW